MPVSEQFYVTTPIYYVNDRPHLGHVYTTMVADVVARYHRLRGDDTFFLTGVDEHATKVAAKATEKGLSAQAWADQNAAAFREVFGHLKITNDDFVRTSEDRHTKRVTRYVRALLDAGDVYQATTKAGTTRARKNTSPRTKPNKSSSSQKSPEGRSFAKPKRTTSSDWRRIASRCWSSSSSAIVRARP